MVLEHCYCYTTDETDRQIDNQTDTSVRHTPILKRFNLAASCTLVTLASLLAIFTQTDVTGKEKLKKLFL